MIADSAKVTMSTERRWIAVWDLPVRIFHWALVLLIGTSWWTAETGRVELHMVSCSGILFLVLFRLVWGLFGTETARFTNFVKGPRRIMAYLCQPQAHCSVGHNPLGALSVIALLVVILLQAISGLFLVGDDLDEGPLAHLMSYNINEASFQLHEKLFNVVIAVIGLHLVAVIFYVVILRKRLIRPMITGRTEFEGHGGETLPVSIWRAFILAAIVGATVAWVASGAPGIGRVANPVALE